MEDASIRWLFAAGTAAIAVLVIAKRDTFGHDEALIGVDAPAVPRLRAAVARRAQTEQLPSAAIAFTLSGCLFAGAAVLAFTPARLPVVFAVLFAVMAVAFAALFARADRAGSRRVAGLRPRERTAVVPAWLWAFVALTAVTPLAFFDIAALPAIIVTASSVAVGLIGDRVARLPAILPGVDPAVEAYVDERLRIIRCAAIFGFATVPPYAFAMTALLGAPLPVTWSKGIAVGVAFAGMMAFNAWFVAVLKRVRRGPDAAQAERWADSGA